MKITFSSRIWNSTMQGASLNLATAILWGFDLFPPTLYLTSTKQKRNPEHPFHQFEHFCRTPKCEGQIGNGELVMGKQRNTWSSLTRQRGIGLGVHWNSTGKETTQPASNVRPLVGIPICERLGGKKEKGLRKAQHTVALVFSTEFPSSWRCRAPDSELSFLAEGGCPHRCLSLTGDALRTQAAAQIRDQEVRLSLRGSHWIDQ